MRYKPPRPSSTLLHLNIRAFVPSDDFDETAYFYGRNLRDHIAAASHNLMASEAPFLERAVFYDELSSESIASLERLCRERGEQALLDINREALRMADADDARGGRERTHDLWGFLLR